MTPLLLLDVDGVLNALGDDEEHFGAWPQWCAGNATADGVSWPILWAPAVIDQLRAWHDDGELELQWLTTWGHEANDELRVLLDMPKLAVAGTYDEEGAAVDAGPSDGATSHAEAAPAAPDPLTGRWWKYDVVRRLVEQQPDRLVIWVDDELHEDGPFRQWAEAVPLLQPIGPDPMTGLRTDDLAEVTQLLAVA